MKKFSWPLMAALVVGGMASCTNEDYPVRSGNYNGEMAPVTASVKVGGDDTRTIREEDSNGLGFKWENGDVRDILLVTDKQGNNIGTMTINGINETDATTATFDGGIRKDMLVDGAKVNVFYLGRDVTNVENRNSSMSLDLSAQSGTERSLVGTDVMMGEAEIHVENGNATLKFEIHSLLGFAHYRLEFPGSVISEKADVVISGANLINRTTVSFANGLTEKQAGDITVSDASLVRDGDAVYCDLYVTVIPNTEVELTFTATVDGENYNATLPVREYKADRYFWGYDGKHGPDGRTVLMYDKTPAVDHSKNPLKKWAEGNLVYNSSTGTSYVSADPYEGGSLYQWGKNKGYADYRDAMGSYNAATGAYSYGTYENSYYAGEGFDPNDVRYSKGSQRYTEQSQLTGAGRNMFTIGDCQVYVDQQNGGDYWRFVEDSGSNWDERAVKMKYANAIAPEGYRMPKKADFMEIFPREGVNTTTYGLASAIDNRVELKNLTGGEPYAVKWNLSTKNGVRYLKISAIMLPNDFDSSNLSSIDWSDENVVTRIFPATGAIEAYFHHHVNSQYNALDVCRPMPFGHWNVSLRTYPNAYNPRYWSVQYENIVDAGKTNEGAYWVSDVNMIFRFRDNQGRFGGNNTTSFVGAAYQPKQNAFAVRCVKVEE